LILRLAIIPVWTGLAALVFGLPARGLDGDLPTPSPAPPGASAAVGSASGVPAHLAFFPPAPPPLDSTPLPAEPAKPEFSPPDELAAFVNEPFYAPLGTRLASSIPDDQLSDEQKRQLDAYRAKKAALQTELLAHLYTLKEAGPAARLQALEAFAREQTPRLVALERGAEVFRHELIRSGPGARPLHAGDLPGPGLPFALQPDDPLQAMRASIFYGEGLSPAQRRLAREILIEQDDAVRGGWIFFSPDTGRVRLPASLPAALAGRVASYVQAKELLKRELRAALCPPTTPGRAGCRRQELESLAVQQAPRIAALEAQAEDIRRGLQGLIADPLRAPHLSSLPPALEERIATYRQGKLELQKALLARVKTMTGSDDSGSPAPDGRTQQAIAAFTRENAATYAALEKEKEGIRTDLARIASSDRSGGAGSGQSADRLLRDFSASFQQYEQWRLYYAYRIAAYEPGLSSEQRRLLFDGAIEKLALPLPGGIPQAFVFGPDGGPVAQAILWRRDALVAFLKGMRDEGVASP
jgi:hypothetical protein